MAEIVNSDGEMLWKPNDFGTYSVDKIKAISDILKDLLSSITLNMSSVVTEQDPDGSGFYTRSQADEKFLIAETARQLIEDLARQYVQTFLQESAVTADQHNEVRNWLINLYQQVTGINLNDPKEPSGSYIIGRIDDLTLKDQSTTSNLMAIMRDLYKVNTTDGSFTSEVKYADKDIVGIVTDTTGRTITSLSSDFTQRGTLVAAMNELLAKIKAIPDTSSVIGNLSSADAYFTDKSSIISMLNSIASSISSINSKISNLESDISGLSARIKSLEDDSGATS